MDGFIVNKKTGRVMKIGSRVHKRYLLDKIRENTENKTVLSNISIYDSKKIKKSLPILKGNHFYCYDTQTQTVKIKNKSLKVDEVIKYICNKIPLIMDKIIDDISEDADRDTTKKKMIEIFYDSLME